MDLKKIVVIISVVVASSIALAKAPSYEKVLKQWTRDAQVFVWDNFEERLVWHATYLSTDYRAARRQKLADLYEWRDDELSKQAREDAQEESSSDVFFLAIYAGSSKWPEIGKDDGKWRIVLEQDGGSVVELTKLERIPITQVERELYPFLDKWSTAYFAHFPKMIRNGAPFRLRMTGIPAKSELVWK